VPRPHPGVGRPVNFQRLQHAAPAETWKQLALCRGLDPDLFYGGVEPEQAAQVCRLCPVKVPCLEYALAVEEWEGIWGGMTGEERYRLSVLRKMKGNSDER
jgi:WhiB family transcriptional regulator, redox-sensing transcriptional regulator